MIVATREHENWFPLQGPDKFKGVTLKLRGDSGDDEISCEIVEGIVFAVFIFPSVYLTLGNC